jgi:hypothetical protein
MAKYTVELRNVIASGYSIGLLDYPIFDAAYRAVLNKKITDHFSFREIGFETPALFKHYLNMTMSEIMPYYNDLYSSKLLSFNPLYTMDLHEELVRENSAAGSSLGETLTNGSSSGIVTQQDDGLSVKSDTPQSLLSAANIKANLYASQADRQDNLSTNNSAGNSSADQSSEQSTASSSLEEYAKHVFGNSGSNFSQLLQDFRSTFVNIDVMIIHELDNLFMGVY